MRALDALRKCSAAPAAPSGGANKTTRQRSSSRARDRAQANAQADGARACRAAATPVPCSQQQRPAQQQ
eukprot:5261524-Pleurochrysis_carterae.AAC.2